MATERWEIKQRLDKLDPQEQDKFLNGLIKDCKRIISVGNLSVLERKSLQVSKAVCALACLSGAVLMALSAKFPAFLEYGASAFIGGIAGSAMTLFSSIFIDDKYKMEKNVEKAMNAKEEIEELKAIKEDLKNKKAVSVR